MRSRTGFSAHFSFDSEARPQISGLQALRSTNREPSQDGHPGRVAARLGGRELAAGFVELPGGGGGVFGGVELLGHLGGARGDGAGSIGAVAQPVACSRVLDPARCCPSIQCSSIAAPRYKTWSALIGNSSKRGEPGEIAKEKQMEMDEYDRWLTRKELATRLGVPEKTPGQWATKGTGPRYARFGRHVRYRLSGVIAWEQEQLVDAA